VAKQVKHDLAGAWIADRKANRDAVTQNKDGSKTLHVTAGTSSPDGKVALLEYFPHNLDAKPGDKVVFTPKSPNEPHTVTFPGDLGTDMIAYCEAGSVDVPFGPPAFNCNGGPPDEIELDGGNGVSLVTAPPGPGQSVSDSGIIAPHRLTQQIGASSTDVLNTWTISLAGAAPGIYTYVCQIHDGMHGSITVH
jgi:plastocyanin